jgi:hypothetical protein
MAKLPENQKTTAAKILEWWEKKPQQNRPHLGASQIGKECERALWYGFRWAKSPSFDGRMLRLFDRGHKEEARFIEELRGIGVEVYDRDDATGDQIRISAVDGHFAGSCDGVGRGFPEAPKSWAVIEFKTSSNKLFEKLKKEGIKAAKYEHFCQATIYGYFLELDRAMYLVANKDTDEIYCEWIHLDKDLAEKLVAKAERIIKATEPPPGISTDPGWYQCKFCDFYSLCHEEKIAESNCRTCCHSTPVKDAKWHCGMDETILTEKKQRKGCEAHIYIPPLIPFAKPVDGTTGTVTYEMKDGTQFTNGPGHWLSSELAVVDPKMIGDKILNAVKDEFPGSKVVDAAFVGFSDLEGDFDKECATALPDPKADKLKKQNKAFIEGGKK